VRSGAAAGGAASFTAAELALFMRLTTPALIQDFLDTIPMNHETEDDTCLSALESVRQNCAHCIEGAMLGAYILSMHGHPPYLCDMRACSRDDDHNVAVFQQAGCWRWARDRTSPNLWGWPVSDYILVVFGFPA
jgi:hypothetical protein